MKTEKPRYRITFDELTFPPGEEDSVAHLVGRCHQLYHPSKGVRLAFIQKDYTMILFQKVYDH